MMAGIPDARAPAFLRLPLRTAAIAGLLAVAAVLAQPASATAAHVPYLETYLPEMEPAEAFPGADRLGRIEGKPPAAAAYKDERLLGYVFLNSDAVNATGYSGKPIHVLIGLNLGGVIVGARLVDHSEPIVLIGIPERKVADFISGYVGMNVLERARGVGREPSPMEIVSGATVTVMVVDDTIRRAAIRVARSRALGGEQPVAAEPAPGAPMTIDASQREVKDWITLLGDGSVRRLRLSIADVNRAFAESGNEEAAARPERGEPDETFIDLYAALVTIPTIGLSLLGEDEYALLEKRLAPGQQAILVAADGRYSFKGSGYVRGGIFDRIQLIQDENTVRFRDKDHRRLGELAAPGAPDLREVDLFVIPEGREFDPAQPWRLQLLVQRAVGALEKAFITFDLGYIPPEKYFTRAAAPAPAEARPAPPAAPEAVAAAEAEEEVAPLWQRIWRQRVVDIGVLVAALGLLTAIFFFQDWLVRRPRLTRTVRYGFLVFTLVWIGGYAQAQLSVVNVLTFTNALFTDFSWDSFLVDPLIFILWFSVAASLLFWGRGPFCGWLCPFGALQELLNRLGRLVRIPQLEMPWGLHERLWPIKYILFMGLFGLSLYSLNVAEKMSEVEPFKTAIILRFVREWPFVAYAGALLVVGLFVERFFCRYLCPLGAALAIPGRVRMFDWLRRYDQCGSPCQRCANECFVGAIHPEGHINPNECLYCLHCQTLYYDEHRCPVMIEKRLRRERRQALRSKSMAPAADRREKTERAAPTTGR